MARVDLLRELIYRARSKTVFNYEAILGPRVFDLLSPYDVQLLDDISKDPKLITKLDKRLEMNDQILGARGFMRITQGTNRAVYKYLNDQSFVLKTAISVKGREDSPAEMVNQQKLKPFVAKCFDVSPTGIVGTFERVEDITSREQFYNIADDVFNLLDHIIGKYVMADIGTEFFRNYGLRIGFGPVLLDYPMLYEIDGAKLYCNAPDFYTGICRGAIDYDAGFNFLYCEKCGKQYSAKQLKKDIESNRVEMKLVGGERSNVRMKLKLFEGEDVIDEIMVGTSNSDTYVKNRKNQKNNKPKKKTLTIVDDSGKPVEGNDGSPICKDAELNSEEVTDEDGLEELTNDETEQAEVEETVSESDTVESEDSDTDDETTVLEGEENFSYADTKEADEVEEQDPEPEASDAAEEEEEEEEEIIETDEFTPESFFQQIENIKSFSMSIVENIKCQNFENIDMYISFLRASAGSLNDCYNSLVENRLLSRLYDQVNTMQVVEDVTIHVDPNNNQPDVIDVQSPEELRIAQEKAEEFANY